MKILFTADWHIKLGQKNVPIDWAKNRYLELFNTIYKISIDCDMLIIGGDIFDRLPTMDELELYYTFIKGISIRTIIIPGNHEALKKTTTFLTNLNNSSTWINPYVTILDDFATIEGIDFIPYNKLKEIWPTSLTNKILVSHCRGEIPPHVKPEIDLALLDRWELVLAGDLHSYANSQRNIVYPGSPITTSFHRSLVDTGVILLDTDTLEYEWRVLDMPQLLRKTIKAGEPMPASEYHHTIYEVEGDMSELSSLENSALLDKKVVKRESDTTLILSPEMTIAHEVEEYLKYVLQLNETAVAEILEELNGCTINE